MAQSTSADEPTRRMALGFEQRSDHSVETQTGARAGNAIVGVAVSAVLWLMLALLLLLVFWR